MKKTDAAYIAGLFDADGCVSYKKYKCADKRYKDSEGNIKKYWMWDIRLEIAMTDESVVRWVHEVVGLGTVTKKPPHKTSLGKKMHYRWRCSSREAYKVCKLMWPYAHVKMPKIQAVIDHYDGKIFDNKIVDLKDYKKVMNLE